MLWLFRTCSTAKVMEHQTRRSAILKNELNIKGMHMSEIKTTVLQFMLESFIFFVFTNRDWVIYCKVFIGGSRKKLTRENIQKSLIGFITTPLYQLWWKRTANDISRATVLCTPHNNPLKEHNLFVDQQWSFKTNISRLLLGACN